MKLGSLFDGAGGKPKTENQIRKWLAAPHSDSAEHKMWGNGMALPCVLYVLEGVKEILKEAYRDGFSKKYNLRHSKIYNRQVRRYVAHEATKALLLLSSMVARLGRCASI